MAELLVAAEAKLALGPLAVPLVLGRFRKTKPAAPPTINRATTTNTIASGETRFVMGAAAGLAGVPTFGAKSANSYATTTAET